MNKKLLSTLAAIVVVILAVLGFQAFTDIDDKDTTDKSETTSQEETTAETDVSLEITEDPANPVDASSTSELAPDSGERGDTVLTPLQGVQQGSAQLLLPILNFPDATMVTNADDSFSLEASGLSLSLLGNTALQVDGEYPSVLVNASGAIDITGDDAAELNLTSLAPSFYLEAADGTRTDVDAATSETIVAGLASSGITIPSVSEDAPAILPVTVTESAGTVTLRTTDAADFLAVFTTN